MENKNNNIQSPANKITRKEALKKAGKYAAITTATMLLVLSPKEAAAGSEATPPPVW